MNLINILYILEFFLITLGFRYIIQPTDNLTGIMITPRELWTVPYLLGWCALVFYIGPLIVIPWTFYSIFTFVAIVIIYQQTWEYIWKPGLSFRDQIKAISFSSLLMMLWYIFNNYSWRK